MTDILNEGMTLALSGDVHCNTGDCWNRGALERFAETADFAGQVVCQGSVENPAGRICTAQIETATPVALVARDEPLGNIAVVPGFRVLDSAA